MIDVSVLRENYAKSGLSRDDLTEKPIDLFEKWLKQAIDSGMPDLLPLQGLCSPGCQQDLAATAGGIRYGKDLGLRGKYCRV